MRRSLVAHSNAFKKTSTTTWIPHSLYTHLRTTYLLTSVPTLEHNTVQSNVRKKTEHDVSITILT